MSRDDIVARLSELRKSYPHAFIEGEMKSANNRSETLELIEEAPAEKDPRPAD
jgi:hypothetical protein